MPLPNPSQLDRRAMTLMYGAFLGIPALRGLWYPGASVIETGNLPDMSGQGRTMAYNGNPLLNLYNDSVPYVAYDGTGDFHSRASEAGLQIVGTETYVASALRGITIGAIFRATSTPASGDGICGKYLSTGNQRQYGLFYTNPTTLQFAVSSDGTSTAPAFAQISLAAEAVGTWTFAVGRFKPSTELLLFRNGTTGTNVTSIPATCFATGTDAFTIARGITAALQNTIDVAVTFLSAAALSDGYISYLFNLSRGNFGV